MTLSSLVALGAIAALHFLLSRFPLVSAFANNGILLVAALFAYVALSLIHISVSQSMRSDSSFLPCLFP